MVHKHSGAWFSGNKVRPCFMSFTLGLHPLTRLIFNLNADVLRIGHILHFFSKFLHKKCSNLHMVMQQLKPKLKQLLRKPMQPTIAVPHATSCCTPPPPKLLIFKDFSESLSYIYIKAKVINKIVSLIQQNKKKKIHKTKKTFQLLYKTAPHFSRWSKRGDKRRYAP